MDGMRPLGALFRVVLPAARPGVIAVAVYSFMTSWGEILFASVMTNDDDPDARRRAAELLHPDQRVLEPDDGGVAGRQRPDRRRLPAAAAYLVAGLTAGAVK